MNHFIKHLNGDVIKPDGTTTNLLELLGVSPDPISVPNDGRGLTISSVTIGGKQYALSDILTAFAGFTPDISNPQDGDTLVYNAAQSKWVNGEPSGGVLVVNQGENFTLDKTWQEIYDAHYAIIQYKDATSKLYSLVKECYVDDGSYYVSSPADSGNDMLYVASSASGYPVWQLGGGEA